MYSQFHGENHENRYVDEVIREYFPDYNYHGIFFEVGAFEPIRMSNSYHFEKNGWTAYCIEANPDQIKFLKEHRKNVIHAAVYDEDKESTEFSVVHNGEWTAGFSAIEISSDYLRVFAGHPIIHIKKVHVPQKTLNTVINEYCPTINTIDVMTIDVEGGELKVLKGLDIDKYKPKVFVIENVTNCKVIQSYLEDKGYILDKQYAYNQFYIRK
jgi:FkbM family methyltransferase